MISPYKNFDYSYLNEDMNRLKIICNNCMNDLIDLVNEDERDNMRRFLKDEEEYYDNSFACLYETLETYYKTLTYNRRFFLSFQDAIENAGYGLNLSKDKKRFVVRPINLAMEPAYIDLDYVYGEYDTISEILHDPFLSKLLDEKVRERILVDYDYLPIITAAKISDLQTMPLNCLLKLYDDRKFENLKHFVQPLIFPLIMKDSEIYSDIKMNEIVKESLIQEFRDFALYTEATKYYNELYNRYAQEVKIPL